MDNRKDRGNKTPKERNLASGVKINTLKLDGVEYNLKPFNMNMMGDLEDKFDDSFTNLMGEPRMKVIRCATWLRMKDEYPDMTEEKLGELVTIDVLTDVYNLMIG